MVESTPPKRSYALEREASLYLLDPRLVASGSGDDAAMVDSKLGLAFDGTAVELTLIITCPPFHRIPRTQKRGRCGYEMGYEIVSVCPEIMRRPGIDR